MSAKDLRISTDGIRVTGFEGLRRIRPEVAQQQCVCGEICGSDCRFECGGVCDDYCWDLCWGDEIKQATLISHPHAMTSTQYNAALRNDCQAGEYY